MERDWLEGELASGRSMESIAREAGVDPSTVSYWVRRHSLRSAHAARHAPRGGIPADVLEALIAQGLSSREIAERLGCSQSTVRHWLGRHGLRTNRAAARASRVVPSGDSRRGTCPVHGETEFRRRPDGYWRCLACRSEHVSAWRRRTKRLLVEEAGGRCVLCGYDRCISAMHFHHLEPRSKRFHLAQGGVGRSLAEAREEAAKCVLLCANCHAEVEAGIANLPSVPEPAPV